MASPSVVTVFPPPARTAEEQLPLVSIGIPTYNRLATLRRTVQSALAQDYGNLEIVVSDNASTDGTQAFCEEVRARDPRVRYIRQPVNLGAVANFHEALNRSTGEFFMWLADDDWIDASYVTACAAVLRDPRYALVAGTARYYRGENHHSDGAPTNLLAADPAARVADYYRQVADNGVFYGLARRRDLMEEPVPTVVGGDWLAVARLACRGRIATVPGVHVHRAMEGASDGLESLVRAYGLRGRHARNPYGLVARAAVADVLWGSPVFRTLGAASRANLAAGVAAGVYRRYYAPIRGLQTRSRLLGVLRRVPGAAAAWHLGKRLLRPPAADGCAPLSRERGTGAGRSEVPGGNAAP